MEIAWRGVVGWAIDVRRALEWSLSHVQDVPICFVIVGENALGEIGWWQPCAGVDCRVRG